MTRRGEEPELATHEPHETPPARQSREMQPDVAAARQLGELLISTLQQIQEANVEGAELARGHQAARERVFAAERALNEAKGGGRMRTISGAKSRTRRHGAMHAVQSTVRRAEAELAAAESALVQSMKRLESRHAGGEAAPEAVRAGETVLRAARKLAGSLEQALAQQAEGAEERAAALAESEAERRREAQEAAAAIERLRAQLAENEEESEQLYALLPQLRQQADAARGELAEESQQLEALQGQVTAGAEAAARADEKARQARQELAAAAAKAARELAELEAELHRGYSAKLRQAESALAERERRVDELTGPSPFLLCPCTLSFFGFFRSGLTVKCLCCAAEVDSLQQQLQQSAQATAAAEQREAEASQAAQAQATAAIAAAAKAESSAALVAGGGSAADGGAQPEPEEDQGGKTAESSGQEVSKGDKERQQQADRARRAAEEAAAAAEAEAGAGQSPTRLDHVRMGGVGASIAAERRKLSALKKEVKGQRWVATEVSRCRPAAITLTFLPFVLRAAVGSARLIAGGVWQSGCGTRWRR